MNAVATTTIVDELLVGEPGDGGGDFVGREAALRELVLELSGGVIASSEDGDGRRARGAAWRIGPVVGL